jgi:hypothetical protein
MQVPKSTLEVLQSVVSYREPSTNNNKSQTAAASTKIKFPSRQPRRAAVVDTLLARMNDLKNTPQSITPKYKSSATSTIYYQHSRSNTGKTRDLPSKPASDPSVPRNRDVTRSLFQHSLF